MENYGTEETALVTPTPGPPLLTDMSWDYDMDK